MQTICVYGIFILKQKQKCNKKHAYIGVFIYKTKLCVMYRFNLLSESYDMQFKKWCIQFKSIRSYYIRLIML